MTMYKVEGFSMILIAYLVMVLKMENMMRRDKWRKKGCPKELYSDISCNDALVYPKLPLPR